jgi:L-threonylcarbamoyladenylate synthase
VFLLRAGRGCLTVDWSRNPRIRRAADRLRRGGVVAYPTEAVWGLGCDPLNEAAFRRLLTLKSRPLAKGVILISADRDSLAPYIGPLTVGQWQRLRAVEGRPVTWVVPAGAKTPAWLTGGRSTLAVRVTDHPVAAGLCRAFGGPLVSTSANPGGREPARSSLRVRLYFDDLLDDLVPGLTGGGTRPSEIRDIDTGKVFRPGG